MKFERHILGVAVVCCLASCNSGQQAAPLPAKPIGRAIQVMVPLGLPALPVPDTNPPTVETVALGKALYFSPLLSSDRSLACANCHDPQRGFADGQAVSTGVGGKKGNRSAPTVLNAAYYSAQFWDGRAASLEEQASGPMINPVEMAHTIPGVERVVAQDLTLRAMFETAFGPAPQGVSPVTMQRITNAIAAYERTVLAGNSPFDRYQYGRDRRTFRAAARRGLEIFKDKNRGNCAVCHTIDAEYALFTDNKFHNLGVGVNAEGVLTDMGRYEVTKKEEDRGAFRTPTLRNVAQTAPYMHDGSLKTLLEVVDFYVGGGNSNPHRDKEIKELKLNKRERSDLVAFLESLTGVVTQ